MGAAVAVPLIAAVAGPMAVELFRGGNNNNNNDRSNKQYYMGKTALLTSVLFSGFTIWFCDFFEISEARNKHLEAQLAIAREDLRVEQHRRREYKEKYIDQKAENDRLKTWIGVAIVSFVGTYLALQVFAGRSAQVGPAAYYPPYVPTPAQNTFDSYGSARDNNINSYDFHPESRYDGDHSSNREGINCNYVIIKRSLTSLPRDLSLVYSETFHNNDEGPREKTADEGGKPTPRSAEFSAAHHRRSSGVIATSFYAILDFVLCIFNLVVVIAPGLIVLFLLAVYHDFCTKEKLDFLPTLLIMTSLFVAFFGLFFGFFNVLYGLFAKILPGVIVFFVGVIIGAVWENSTKN